jgi:phosphatidylglycerophosphate synthase
MILIGILIMHFTVILDNVNGEVARYWKEDGIIGTFLENVYHNLAVPLIFFALSYGVFLKTGFYPILIFGFLSAVLGKPIMLSSIKDAVVAERLSEIKSGKKVKLSSATKADIKGGATKIGKKLYGVYDIIREFWVYPANIVHITILAIIEIINLQQGFFPQYMLLSLYIIIYGAISALIQITAFIVNYKGKTVEHYYKELFERK